jgi:outer membrane immunogenic protein
MRASIHIAQPFAALSLLAMVLIALPQAGAQAGAGPEKASRAELGLEYNYVRSNAPPGDCGCFNLNGGSADFAWFLKRNRFALVADVSVTNGSAIAGSGYDLTLTSATFGGRYEIGLGHTGLHPFGQVLAGVAHASGSLVSGQSPAASNAGAAFAANTGGGLELRLNHRFALRLVDAEYFVTTFDNGKNDHQNNLRIGAGLALRF